MADFKDPALDDCRFKVLLVEDNDGNILVNGTFLEFAGYAYDVAKNGLDAVEKFKSGAYFAILMDVQMPGVGGFGATKMIREYESLNGKPRTPIIGLTAYALVGDRERCLAAGMDDYLSKPTTFEELAGRLDKYRQQEP